MKGSKALLVTLAMTAGLLGLVIGLRGPYARLSAQRWRKQLDSVPDDRAAALLGQVARLGEPGIPVLVEALGSQRESVARAGKKVLCQQLSRWQMLRDEGSSRRQAVLADALAERAGRFGPTARRDAAQLATQILLWLPDSKLVDRSRVIGSCQKVFRAAATEGDLPQQDNLAAGQASLVGETGHRRLPADDPTQFAMQISQLSRLPGGGLPIEPLPFPEPPPEAEVARLAEVPPGRPGRLANPSEARALDPLGQARQPPAVSDDATGRSQSANSFAGQQSEPTPIRSFSPDGPDGAWPRKPPDELAEAETIDLMRWLRGGDESTAAGAEAELTRRGFRAVHLEVARRLFDPDPQVRKQLVHLLPGLQSVDPAPWLLQLGRDENSEVRLAAITLMATTGDPELLKQVEQIARQDPDPRIQHQARRIAGRRNGGTY